MILHSLLFLLFLVSSAHCEGSSAYLSYVKEIISEFADEMQERYPDLHCSGSGGRMPKDVEEIDVNFVACMNASIEEARKIEVDAIERLLKRINNHTKIRPFLREHPFGPNRVDISISFFTNDGTRPVDGSIALMFLSRGRIVYRKAELQKVGYPGTIDCRDPNNVVVFSPAYEKIEDVLIPLYEEPYEEAVKIVKGQTENKK